MVGVDIAAPAGSWCAELARCWFPFGLSAVLATDLCQDLVQRTMGRISVVLHRALFLQAGQHKLSLVMLGCNIGS